MNNKKTKNVLISHEEKMSLEQAAALLEEVAKKLREEGSFTLNLGEQSHFVEPAETVELEIELEEKNGEYELEFEIEWNERDKENYTITIE